MTTNIEKIGRAVIEKELAPEGYKTWTITNRTLFLSTVVTVHALYDEINVWIDETGSNAHCEYSTDGKSGQNTIDFIFFVGEYRNNEGYEYKINKTLEISFRQEKGEMKFDNTDGAHYKWQKTNNPVAVMKAFKRDCDNLMDSLGKEYDAPTKYDLWKEAKAK